MNSYTYPIFGLVENWRERKWRKENGEENDIFFRLDGRENRRESKWERKKYGLRTIFFLSIFGKKMGKKMKPNLISIFCPSSFNYLLLLLHSHLHYSGKLKIQLLPSSHRFDLAILEN